MNIILDRTTLVESAHFVTRCREVFVGYGAGMRTPVDIDECNDVHYDGRQTKGVRVMSSWKDARTPPGLTPASPRRPMSSSLTIPCLGMEVRRWSTFSSTTPSIIPSPYWVLIPRIETDFSIHEGDRFVSPLQERINSLGSALSDDLSVRFRFCEVTQVEGRKSTAPMRENVEDH
ncbi:hypothetical protein K435DRAFT_856940 [Dendrothele bispora CBS 962.96]|uniref:Uncharacterized protein n=1 Tax=Dendrothele bispora (strain CBS 962.96) TaxID=1314807 RepID=A0A4S8M738_DENBC|nr:hypothetical protein K435DRAFT_856940 [Dendrothele bispora CBS 962.96]